MSRDDKDAVASLTSTYPYRKRKAGHSVAGRTARRYSARDADEVEDSGGGISARIGRSAGA